MQGDAAAAAAVVAAVVAAEESEALALLAMERLLSRVRPVSMSGEDEDGHNEKFLRKSTA
jgi:hypothetical protein